MASRLTMKNDSPGLTEGLLLQTTCLESAFDFQRLHD